MKYPALGPTLLFAFGVGAAVWWGGRPDHLAWASGLALLLAMVHRKVRIPGLALALVLLGWAYQAERLVPHSPWDLRRQLDTNDELVTLVGEVDETPTLRLSELRGQWRGRTLVPLRVSAWSSQGNRHPGRGLVLVNTPGVLPREFFRGQQVEVTGVLRRPPGPEADQLFDYRSYLEFQGCWFTLRVERVEDWQLAPNHRQKPPWSERFIPWAQALLTHGLPDDEATRLIVAMALGWKTPLTGEVNDIFMRSGTMHVFAISGLHIGLIAWILVEVLRLFRVSRAGCGWIAIPLVWFYVAATGWQASAIRSAIMSSVVVAGWTLNRPGQLLNSLAVSAWIILVWDPGQLFQASFQLSFAAVAGLALLGPPLDRGLKKYLRIPRDPFLPEVLEARWHRWVNLPLRILAQALAVGLASLVASLPFTVHWFHLLNPVSLLANLVVVPLSSLALAANFASVLTGSVAPWLAGVFNASAWVLMHGMIAASDAAARLPYGHVWTESPPWLWWLLYFALVLCGTLGWWSRYPRLLSVGFMAVAMAAGVAWYRHHQETRLTVIRGDGLVECGPEGTVVFDGGNDSAVEWGMVPYLHAHGVRRLAGVSVTGESVQQVGGIPRLLEEFRPRFLWMSPFGSRSPSGRKIIADCKDLQILWETVSPGQVVQNWRILHPSEDDRLSRGEDRALVQETVIHGYRVVWMGDLGRPGQRQWFDRGITHADIVITGVPPNSEPLGNALLMALSPQLVVVMSDRYPANRRVKSSTRERLQASGYRTVFTEEVGSLVLRFRAVPSCVASGDGWEFPLSSPGSTASP